VSNDLERLPSRWGPHGPFATKGRKAFTLNGRIEDQDVNGSVVDACNVKDAAVIAGRFAWKQGGAVPEIQKTAALAWQLTFTGVQELMKTPQGAAYSRGVDYTKGVQEGGQVPVENLTIAQAARSGAAMGRWAAFFAALQKCATLNYHITPRDTHIVIGSALCVPLWLLGMVGLIKDDVARLDFIGGTKATKAAFFGENAIGALQRFTGGGFMRKLERANYSFMSTRTENLGFLKWHEIISWFIHGGFPQDEAPKMAWQGSLAGLPAMAT
jgi:hypothetical protein